MKTDTTAWLTRGALIAALVGTASAEYSLAVACGFAPWFAWCVPASLDLYVMRALRAGREVSAVVIAMVVVNAASHLVSSGMVAMSPGLVIAVSAIAPLVLWRVNALQADPPEREKPVTICTNGSSLFQLELPDRQDEELSLVDQLLMGGEPLPGRGTVVKLYGVTEHEARVALVEAKARMEKAKTLSP